jgi:hypothetical protein
MKYLFLFLFIFCLLFSCGEKQSDEVIHSDSAEVVPIDVGNISDVKASELFSKIEYIPLETNDSCLLGSIKKLLLYDNRFFILDEFGKSVFVFSENGKFIHAISQVGIGPNEYTDLADILIDHDNRLLILDGKSKLLYFDISSYRFVREQKRGSGTEISYLGDETVACYIHDIPDAKNELIIERKGKTVYEHFTNRKSLAYFYYIPAWFNAKDDKSVFFIRPFDDRVYLLNRDSIGLEEYLNFGEQKISDNFVKNMPKENKSKWLLNSDYCHSVSNYYKNDNIRSFTFTYKAKEVTYIRFFKKGKEFMYNTFVNDLSYSSSPDPILTITDACLISYVQIYEIESDFSALSEMEEMAKKHMKDYYEKVKSIAKRSIEDNPVLIKWYF